MEEMKELLIRKVNNYLSDQVGERVWAGEPFFQEEARAWLVPIMALMPDGEGEQIVVGIALFDEAGNHVSTTDKNLDKNLMLETAQLWTQRSSGEVVGQTKRQPTINFLKVILGRLKEGLRLTDQLLAEISGIRLERIEELVSGGLVGATVEEVENLAFTLKLSPAELRALSKHEQTPMPSIERVLQETDLSSIVFGQSRPIGETLDHLKWLANRFGQVSSPAAKNWLQENIGQVMGQLLDSLFSLFFQAGQPAAIGKPSSRISRQAQVDHQLNKN